MISSEAASRRLRQAPSGRLRAARLKRLPCLSTRDACGASAFTRSSAKASWTYIGCSAHSVPSLSNVAMRSAAARSRGEPSLVTLATKSTIGCLRRGRRSRRAADRTGPAARQSTTQKRATSRCRERCTPTEKIIITSMSRSWLLVNLDCVIRDDDDRRDRLLAGSNGRPRCDPLATAIAVTWPSRSLGCLDLAPSRRRG